ncbi:hypothetical protein Y032_1512g3906, partial [Ancylostoma ceylanicum]
LYIRKKIKERFLMANKKPVDVTIRRGLLQIGDKQPMKPTIVAYKYGIGLSTWNGLPLRELLTAEEKRAIDSGELKYGTEKLDVDLSDIQLVPSTSSVSNNVEEEQQTTDSNSENCTASSSGNDVGPNNRKRINPSEDKENPAKLLKLN